MGNKKKLRLYDDQGYCMRAACLCVRTVCESEILLVNSTTRSDKWIIPGGGIESGELPQQTAQREALEEAGIRGDLGRFLGWFDYAAEKKHRTAVYVLYVTEELPEWLESITSGRLRIWRPLPDAISLLQQYKCYQIEYIKLMQQTNRTNK